MATLKKAIVVLILFTICRTQATRPEDPYYIAAVVEYNPEGNTSINSPTDIIKMNTNNYISYINQASRHNVDIIVFPECGLTTIYLPQTRPELRPFLTLIPDPAEGNNPCRNTSGNVPEVLRDLSCAAQTASIYVAVNLPEIVPCNGSGCPSDGAFFYNTNIVFDRNGTLIERYRKYNLFGEPGFNITSTAELSTFDTDFGVRFGMSVCFDIYFHDPVMRLAQELQITDMVFSVAWFSELPFLTAVQVQEAWSRSMNINLLASGYDDPANWNGGSGIYAGRDGILNVTMPLTKTSQMLISRVNKKIYETSSNYPHLQNTEDKPKYNSQSERVFFRDYLDPYTTQLLDTAETNTTICDRGLCCQFIVRTSSEPNNPEFTRYRLAVFNGIRVFFGGRTAGTQICSIMACNNSTLASCALPIDEDKQSQVFEFVKIEGNFNRTNSVHMPTTLLDNILPLNVNSFEITNTNITDESTHVRLQSITHLRRVWTFGIYTREYDLDGLPYTVPTSKGRKGVLQKRTTAKYPSSFHATRNFRSN